jgi:hypothetical protein
VHAYGPVWDVSATLWQFGWFCPREEGYKERRRGLLAIGNWNGIILGDGHGKTWDFMNCGFSSCEMSESLLLPIQVCLLVM